MMDLATLRYVNRQAERRSVANKSQPVIVGQDNAEACVRRIPFIGERCPRGWRRVDLRKLKAFDDGRAVYDGPHDKGALFVDISGFGADYEAALSFRQLIAKLQAVALERPGIAWGFLEQGQFQGHIVAFERIAS